MGITKNDCDLLFYSKKLGVSYRETLMLGRLNLYVSHDEILSSIKKYQTNEKELTEVSFKDEYSEPLFEILGAKKVDSMDFSDYEKASIIHDLNVPIPASLKNQFSAIVDGGTIEHIFNFPVAIKSCMDALKIGGHYIGITPANNSMGHGFYQFSPELYFRIFSKENGFKVKKAIISISNGDKTSWFEVADPQEVNSRVMLTNSHLVTLIIIAEKIAEENVFATTPQQNDYVNTWNAHISQTENKIQSKESQIKFLYRKLVPRRLKSIARNIYNILTIEKVSDELIGEYNSEHFTKIDL